jgi:hypothetical protein
MRDFVPVTRVLLEAMNFCFLSFSAELDRETRMKLGHTAATAIVAWYLMIPPVNLDNRVDAGAPLSKWRHGVSFDSEHACKASLKDAIDNPMTSVEYKAAAKATLKAKMHPLSESEMTRRTQESVCVSADDPRLKAKQAPGERTR